MPWPPEGHGILLSFEEAFGLMSVVAGGQPGVRKRGKPESSPHLQGTVEICGMYIHH